MASVKNFEVDQNTTFSFTIEYKDSSGNPIVLQDATAKMQVRDTQGGSKLAVTLTSDEDGGIEIIPNLGKIIITMTPTETNKLFYPKSAYDLMVTDEVGVKRKLLEGYLTLSRSVTI
ncbi:MAG: hypothetical protein RLZZ196_869 [Bacteroidota bacterium]|jgi:hypothetical protein